MIHIVVLYENKYISNIIIIFILAFHRYHACHCREAASKYSFEYPYNLQPSNCAGSLGGGGLLLTTAPPPLLATDSPWLYHLQIYSPLLSLKLKDSPFKLSFFGELIYWFDLI